MMRNPPRTRRHGTQRPERRSATGWTPEPGDDLEAEPPEEVDPDLDAARAMSPSERPDALKTDELRPEEELLEPEPPNEPSPETSSGRTAAEERTRETLEERLAQERPEE